MIWNPLKAESVFRSKRVQGALIVLASTIAPAFGIAIPEDVLGASIEQLGVLWAIIGTITAKNSPRPF
jgi:uncharacterized membrane protein